MGPQTRIAKNFLLLKIFDYHSMISNQFNSESKNTRTRVSIFIYKLIYEFWDEMIIRITV